MADSASPAVPAVAVGHNLTAMPSSGTALKAFLEATKVEEIVPPKRVVIGVSKDDKLDVAFKTLQDHHIVSAPVFDGEKFSSIIDLADIVVAALIISTQASEGQEISKLLLEFLHDPNKPMPDIDKLWSVSNVFRRISVKDVASTKKCTRLQQCGAAELSAPTGTDGLADLSTTNPFVPLMAGSSLRDAIKLVRRSDRFFLSSLVFAARALTAVVDGHRWW
jgi:hypothetical protein